MTWKRWFVMASAAATLLLALPGCGDPCGNIIIDTTMPGPKRVLRPAEALVEAVVIDTHRVSELRISVDLDVRRVLRRGGSDHQLAQGPLTTWDFDHECSERSAFLTSADQPVLVALKWVESDGEWLTVMVMRENADGTITFLEYGESLNRHIDEILTENSVAGVIKEVRRG